MAETFDRANVECDDAMLFVVVNIIEDFFDDEDCGGRVVRGRFDIESVSHVTDIALSVAELERCARFFCVELFSLRELVFPLTTLARATCSGTT